MLVVVIAHALGFATSIQALLTTRTSQGAIAWIVSLNTLRTHTKRIFTKLDVNNRAAAVRRARELGLLRE